MFQLSTGKKNEASIDRLHNKISNKNNNNNQHIAMATGRDQLRGPM